MEKLALLRQQYRGFPDAVIDSLSYNYGNSEHYERILSVEIRCMRFDFCEETEDTPWERMLLKLVGVEAFTFNEPFKYSNVILNDVTCLVEEGYYHFDFSSIEEVTLAEIRNQSSFYVMCKDIAWTVIENLE